MTLIPDPSSPDGEPEPMAGIPMTPEELEKYKSASAAIRERGEALEGETAKIRAETAALEEQNRVLDEKRRELEAQTERMIAANAKAKYQSEIHAVAINVLVSILTKDALKSIKESEYSTAPKLDITQTVEFSLMVAKRYVDELHKISVSSKQIEEYKNMLSMQPALQSGDAPGGPPVAID